MKAKQARKNQRKREKRISCGGIGPAMHGQCRCKEPYKGLGFDALIGVTRDILNGQLEVMRPCKK